MVCLGPDLATFGWNAIRRARNGGWLSTAWAPWLGSDPEAAPRAYEALERCVAYVQLAIEAEAGSSTDSPLPLVLWGEALRAFSEAGFARSPEADDSLEAFALLDRNEATRSAVQALSNEVVQAFHACGERGLVRLRGVLDQASAQQLERFVEAPEQMAPHRVVSFLATAAQQATLVELTRRVGFAGSLQPIRALVSAARTAIPRLIEHAFARVLLPAVEATASNGVQAPRSVASSEVAPKPRRPSVP